MVQKQTTSRSPVPASSDAVWDDLRYALALARDGSVRGAARALGVSHSTVLRRVSELERRMGVRLFERREEGYEATAAGQDVFDTAVEVEDVVGALERRVEGRDQRLSGAVRVTIPPPLFRPLVSVFAEIGRAHPDIELTVAAGMDFADLAHRRADIALRIADEPQPDLVGRRVAGVALGVYGSSVYLKARSTRKLEALDWIRYEAGSGIYFERWMEEHAKGARVALRVDSPLVMHDAVDAGLGVTVMPSLTGDSCRGWQRVRLLDGPMPPLWVLTHRDLRATARVRAVRDAVAAALVGRRDLLEGRGASAPKRRAKARPQRRK